MISVREGHGLWASTQFELQRLIGSGKTSNVYQVQWHWWRNRGLALR
jgi:hypothetical protein